MVLHQTYKLLTKLLLISYLLVRKVSTVISEPTATSSEHHSSNNNHNQNSQVKYHHNHHYQSNQNNDNSKIISDHSQYYHQSQNYNLNPKSNQKIHSVRKIDDRPTRRMLTEMVYYPPLKPYFSSEPVSRSYLPPNYDRVDPWPSPWPSQPHEEDHDDLEKTFLHYIFPTILVIGLGSLIIPIIAVFFIAFTYTNSGTCIKSKNKSLIDKRRPHLIPNILDLLVAVEKAFSKGETNYKTKLKRLIPKKSRSISSNSPSSSSKISNSSQSKHHSKLITN